VYCRAEGWRSGWVPGLARASWDSRAGLEVSDVTGPLRGGSWAARPAESLPARCLDSYLSNRPANFGASSTRTFAPRYTSTPLRSQRCRTLDRMHPRRVCSCSLAPQEEPSSADYAMVWASRGLHGEHQSDDSNHDRDHAEEHNRPL
jgi:hypothetical protein